MPQTPKCELKAFKHEIFVRILNFNKREELKKMKKTISILFAFAMILSLAFIGDAVSSNGSLSVNAQTGRVTVRRKRTGGVVGATGRGARYVYRNGKRVVVYTGRKTYQGGKYVGKKTVQGTRYTAHKTKRGAKAATSRTKKILIGN